MQLKLMCFLTIIQNNNDKKIYISSVYEDFFKPRFTLVKKVANFGAQHPFKVKIISQRVMLKLAQSSFTVETKLPELQRAYN